MTILSAVYFIFVDFVLLFIILHCSADDARNSLRSEFQFLFVPNLTNYDLSSVLIPLPNISSHQTAGPNKGYSHSYFTIRHNSTTNHSGSSIGYEIPCGVRGSEENDTNRIVGGSDATPGEFPWQVSIQIRTLWTLRHTCGGALISRYWVVTAAHCVAGNAPSKILIVAGDHDLYKYEGHEQKVGVTRIVTHGYIKENFTNDIALLQLSSPLKLNSERIAPLCVPQPHHKFKPGLGIITGWGRLSENGKLAHVLQAVVLPLVPKEKCRRQYAQSGYGTNIVGRCQLCSGWDRGGADSCQGDSGGPMICKRPDGFYYLCGIVSWGVGCARPNLPGVYTEVACHADWIRHVLYATTVQEIFSEV